MESWPRSVKELIVLSVDMMLAVVAMWLAYTLRLEAWHLPNSMQSISYGIAVILFLTVFLLTRQYNVVFRYVTISMLQNLARAVLIYAVILTLILSVLILETVPRSVGILQPAIFLILICTSRVFVSAWFDRSSSPPATRRILIYGAGAAGRQLALGLSLIKEDHLVGFIDSDPAKQARSLLNLHVYAPEDLATLKQKYNVTDILLALPSIQSKKRRAIVESLAQHQLRISTMPSLGELVANRGEILDTEPLSLDDILPRSTVEQTLALNSVNGKCVLVTGAGGSIGAEICRQLLSKGIKRLILLDHSEFNLYQIDSEIRQRIIHDDVSIHVETVLADIRNQDRLQVIFQTLKPDILFHAAAYKHVPLVEANPGEAIANNYFGTELLADLAIEHKVKRFILISTDKAVRPTNVMGASKRLAEMVIQSQADKATDTIFAMVRFGNVIGSSGSAIPLFQNQIARGGPVTVTDPEVTRYFMSIPEAVALVLEAGEMASGGEMFVLDMGSPIKVVDLVRRMISLSGKQEKSERNPLGDIEIAYIGLRPGEKMYEELVLGADLQPTSNPRISKAHETFLTASTLAKHGKRLRVAVQASDNAAIISELYSMKILVQS